MCGLQYSSLYNLSRHVSIHLQNAGNDTLVECLNNIPAEKEKYLSSFQTLATIHKLLFTQFPTEIETEKCAKACELFLETYPIKFPSHDISRKTFVLGMILPIFIRREKGRVFKFLSAEEKGESLHKLLNDFERHYCSTPHKPTRYFLMKKAYINRINVEEK